MWKYFIVILLAAFIGVSSANYVVQGHAGLFNQTKGEWIWWPSAGSSATDPYTRFYFKSQNRLPLSRFETLEVEARSDSAGRALSAQCIYQLSGRFPQARWWSLASFDTGDHSGQISFDESLGSHEVMLENDGTVNITIAREIQPGNWIMSSGDDEFSLLLRIYNPVNNFGGGAALGSELPSIVRKVCR